MTTSQADNASIRSILLEWAAATRQGRLDDVLKHHVSDLVIFDVLPPMKYDSAEAYRRSWGDWQPQTQGEGVFELENLVISAGGDHAFAHCFIRCGGQFPDGRSFEDLVRATFCLRRIGGAWQVAHQHVSKPFQPAGAQAQE